MAGVDVCMVDYANKSLHLFGEGVTEVRGKCGRKRIKHHRGLSFVGPVANLRNIQVEPNHDGWCGCLYGRLCKQMFEPVRGRCDGGAWQVWDLLLVANASTTIADYHLLDQLRISEISR